MTIVPNLPEETWAFIPGFEGLYMASNNGKIKSCERLSLNGFRIRERILRPSFEKFGYSKVVLCKDNIIKTFKIHRLVALAFIPNPENKPMVNHIDCNTKNNCVSNLEWCTAMENYMHSVKLGRSVMRKVKIKPPDRRGRHMKGKFNNGASKKVYQYSKTNELIAEWPSISEIIRSGISGDTKGISKSCRSEAKIHNGYRWRFNRI